MLGIILLLFGIIENFGLNSYWFAVEKLNLLI